MFRDDATTVVAAAQRATKRLAKKGLLAPLTPDEAAAIRIYTQESKLYNSLNPHLRSRVRLSLGFRSCRPFGIYIKRAGTYAADVREHPSCHTTLAAFAAAADPSMIKRRQVASTARPSIPNLAGPALSLASSRCSISSSQQCSSSVNMAASASTDTWYSCCCSYSGAYFCWSLCAWLLLLLLAGWLVCLVLVLVLPARIFLIWN